MLALILAVLSAPAIVPVQAPPAIDGSLSDAAWSAIPWQEGLRDISIGKPANPPVRFKLAATRQAFFLAAVLEEPNMQAIRANVPPSARDGKVWNDDCLEVMLDLGSGGAEYFHFVINSRGAVYDARREPPSGLHHPDWNSSARAAVARSKDRWTVELAVPWADLNFHSLTGWRINIARERYAGGRQQLFHLADGASFHNPSAFKPVQPPQFKPWPAAWNIFGPLGLTVARAQAGLELCAKFIVRSMTGRVYLLRAQLSASAGGKTARGEWIGGLDDGQTAKFTISAANPPLGHVNLKLELRSRPKGELLARRSWTADLEYSPLKLTLLRPRYRASIYSTQPLKTVLLRAELGEGLQIAGARLRAALSGSSGPQATAEKPLRGRSATIELPRPKQPGTYTITVTLIRGGKVEAKAATPLHVLPPAPHEWYVGDNNVLYHNGKSFLPAGWFSPPTERLAEFARLGMAAVQQYGAPWWTVEKLRAWLDEVQRAHLYAMFYPYPSPRWFDKHRQSRPLTAQEAQALRERVRAIKDHPALLGYYLCDEPELVPVLPERLEQIYRIIREEDPYHPCIVLNDTIRGIFTYHRAGDILMPDPYPCYVRGGLAERPIEKVTKFMQAVAEATGGLKPAWVCNQAFNYADYGRPNNRQPTLTEMRNEQYQALVAGCRGFMWYGASQIPNYAELQVAVPLLWQELRLMRDAALAPDALGILQVKADMPEHMHTCARLAGGHLYIFAVSTATKPLRATFRLRAKPPLRRVPQRLWVVSEGRSVELRNGTFSDTFGIYATHIYTTRRELATALSLAEAEQRIKQIDRARRKPGNLAFEDTGVQVRVSSNAPYSYPHKLVDGVPAGLRWRDGTARKLPDWIELQWPKPITAGRVVLFSPTAAEIEIRVREPGSQQWRTVARASAAGEADRVPATFQPTQIQALRVVITRSRPGTVFNTAYEVEVYAK